VVAGPGSGKTTVLVEYFRRLVQAGVDPLRILAITFTEKAAAHMREKLARAFREQPEIQLRLERAYVSTVHGFCARLLRENAVFAGIDPEFRILDERESERLQRMAVQRAMDELLEERPAETRALIRGLGSPEPGGPLLGAYDAMRCAGVAVAALEGFQANPPVGQDEVAAALETLIREQPRGWRAEPLGHWFEVRESAARILEALRACEAAGKLRAIAAFRCDLNRLQRRNDIYDLASRIKKELLPEFEYALITECYAAERATLVRAMERLDRLYRERKQQAGGLDYADLEEFAVRLLQDHAETRRRVQMQFDQVLMDEYQDTNGQQARLMDLVRPPERFYAVGDINQSIYGFRHAEPAVFGAYREQVQAGGRRAVELVENFRSRPDILRAVETVLRGAPGIERRSLVAAHSFADKAEPSVEVLAVAGREDAGWVEALWVARRILDLAGRLPVGERRAEFRDFAVLVRNSEVLGDFTAAFERFGIPYLVNRGKGFYETPEVVDLIHLLRVLANPRDEIALAAVLRSPFVEVSDEALLRLKQAGNLGAAVGCADFAGFSANDAARLARFRGQLQLWRAEREFVSPDRLLLRALDQCGYRGESGPRGAANVEKLLAQARESWPRQSLADFVEEIESLRESNPREPDAPPEDSADAVKLMTVHSAKGLEFPVVFLAALHKGLDNRLGPLSFSPRIGLGASWRNPGTGKETSDWFHHAVHEERKRREEDEGNRLLYVGMTRAEEHLVLSLSGKKNWAKTLRESLDLDLEKPRGPQELQRIAPDGEPWRMRIFCTDREPDAAERTGTAGAGEPVLSLAPPALAGQHDSNANVTSVALFAECPRRYYLARYLGWEAPPPGRDGASRPREMDASEFGRQAHAILAGVPVDKPSPAALQLAAKFHASALGRRAARAARAEREFDFVLAVEEIVLRGQIDLWFEEAGELVLVDYKTDEVAEEETRRRAAEYGLQLRLYGMALERHLGRPPDRAYIYFLRPDVAVPVELGPSLLDSPEQAVSAFRAAQENLAFPPREDRHCARCPYYRGLCPSEWRG
jgi:ATP-dependent exoDNAse (exonuclease V) beta subunit